MDEPSEPQFRCTAIHGSQEDGASSTSSEDRGVQAKDVQKDTLKNREIYTSAGRVSMGGNCEREDPWKFLFWPDSVRSQGSPASKWGMMKLCLPSSWKWRVIWGNIILNYKYFKNKDLCWWKCRQICLVGWQELWEIFSRSPSLKILLKEVYKLLLFLDKPPYIKASTIRCRIKLKSHKMKYVLY